MTGPSTLEDRHQHGDGILMILAIDGWVDRLIRGRIRAPIKLETFWRRSGKKTVHKQNPEDTESIWANPAKSSCVI